MAFHPQSNSGYFKPIHKKYYGEERGLWYGRTISSQGVTFIDYSLITSSNYVGGGNWTVDPESNFGSLGILTPVSTCYHPVAMVVIRVNSSGNFSVMDANPQSANYGTTIDNGSFPSGYGITSNVIECIYSPHIDAFIVTTTTGVAVAWKYPGNYIYKSNFTNNKDYSRVNWNPNNGDVILAGGGQDHTLILRFLKNGTVKQIGILDGDLLFPSFSEIYPNVVFGWTSANKDTYGAIRLFDINDDKADDNEILSSLSYTTSAGTCRNAYFLGRNKAYFSLGLTTYEIDVSNPYAISETSNHTRTAISSENITNFINLSERYKILVVIGRNGSGGHVLHFYDISSSLSYIGYKVGLSTVNNSRCYGPTNLK